MDKFKRINKNNIPIFLSVFIISLFFSMVLYYSTESYFKRDLNARKSFISEIKIERATDIDKINKLKSLNYIKKVMLIGETKSIKIGDETLAYRDMNKEFYEENIYELTQGEYPKSTSEILISYDLARDKGYKIGDTVKLVIGDRIVNNTKIKGDSRVVKGEIFNKTTEREVKIVGFSTFKYNRNMNLYSANGLIDENKLTEPLNNEQYYPFINLKNINKIYENRKSIINELGVENYNDNNVTLNDTLIKLYSINENGKRSYINVFMDKYLLLILLIFVFTLLIKSIFSIWGIKKLKELSMYKSIGATKKQIFLILFKDAIKISFIPMILGTMAGIYTLYRFINSFILSTDMINNTTSKLYALNWQIILKIILVLTIIIFISITSPSRKISKINIIDGLKDSYSIKVYKKKRSDDIFKELKINNTRILRPMLIVLIVGETLMAMVFGLYSINYSNNEEMRNLSDYNLEARFSDNLGVLQGEENKIENEKSIIFHRLTGQIKESEINYSKEFLSVGYNKKSLGKIKFPNVIGVEIYGIDEENFKKLGGSSNKVLYLNKVIKDVADSIKKDNYIPFIKDLKSVTMINGQKEEIINIDGEINDFGLYKSILSYPGKYNLILITSIDNLNNIRTNLFKGTKRENEVTMYQLYLKVKEDKLEEYTTFIEDDLKDSAGASDIYRVENNRIKKLIDENENKRVVIIFGLFLLIIFLLNLINSYSAINLEFLNRKKELGTLLSIGMEKRDILKMLDKEIIISLLKAMIYSLIITTIGLFLLSLNLVNFNLMKIIRGVNYFVFIPVFILIPIIIFVLHRIISMEYLNKNLISLIKTND